MAKATVSKWLRRHLCFDVSGDLRRGDSERPHRNKVPGGVSIRQQEGFVLRLPSFVSKRHKVASDRLVNIYCFVLFTEEVDRLIKSVPKNLDLIKNIASMSVSYTHLTLPTKRIV